MAAKFLRRKLWISLSELNTYQFSHDWRLSRTFVLVLSGARNLHTTNWKFNTNGRVYSATCVHWPDDLPLSFVSRISVISCDIVAAYASTFFPLSSLYLSLSLRHCALCIPIPHTSLSLELLDQSGLAAISNEYIFRYLSNTTGAWSASVVLLKNSKNSF